jgi:hypothetical protein
MVRQAYKLMHGQPLFSHSTHLAAGLEQMLLEDVVCLGCDDVALLGRNIGATQNQVRMRR